VEGEEQRLRYRDSVKIGVEDKASYVMDEVEVECNR